MGYKNSLAIIGANTAVGSAIAKSIDTSYRLVLMDCAQNELQPLKREILQTHPGIEVAILNCCKEAAWEADVIVVNIDDVKLGDIAKKLRDVSNCKPVIHFIRSEHEADRLQQLLPNAKVVSILLNQSFAGSNKKEETSIFGTDDDTLTIAKDLIKSMKGTLLNQH